LCEKAAGWGFSFPEVVYSFLKTSARVLECTSATKHKLPRIGDKRSQIVFAGDVRVWQRAGTKNIFLHQEIVVGLVSLVGFQVSCP